MQTKQEALRYLGDLCRQKGEWPEQEEVHELIFNCDNIDEEEFICRANNIATRRNDEPQKEEKETAEEREDPTVQIRRQRT